MLDVETSGALDMSDTPNFIPSRDNSWISSRVYK
jgi:hypothetical protein